MSELGGTWWDWVQAQVRDGGVPPDRLESARRKARELLERAGKRGRIPGSRMMHDMGCTDYIAAAGIVACLEVGEASYRNGRLYADVL